MYGYELQRARQLLRQWKREQARRSLLYEGKALALDEEDLAKGADLGAVNSWGNAIKRRLIIAGLASAGLSRADIAKHWSVPVETIDGWMQVKLMDDRGWAADIEREVTEEHPETPDPGATVQEREASRARVS